jgi:hypothetical protein
MSRKVILSLATAVTIVAAGLASTAADARGGGGGHGGGGHGGGGAHFARGGHGGGHFGGRGNHRSRTAHRNGRGYHGYGHEHRWAHNWRHRWFFRDGVWVDGGYDETAAVAPAEATAPGPCTCLTKNYTKEGLVLFADICTKESASAPVDGKAADASQAPTTQN